MTILLIGSGGREHAIAARLANNSRITRVICAPGNGGMAQLAECFDVKATDIEGLCKLAIQQTADYVIVAPDDPLSLGLVDRLTELGIPAFGPTAAAAEIESSKVYSKRFMQKYSIPTAKFETFDNLHDAINYVNHIVPPIVVKADGLALGKGVIIAESAAEAEAALIDMMQNETFGASGRRVVIEEFLSGREATVLVFCDGTRCVPMPASRDHKRALDGDRGLNTGGMGAISPVPDFDDALMQRCTSEIFMPTVEALKAEGREFRGVLYFGLMLTHSGPKVIEYNARFGDPECQVVLERLHSDCDLLEIMRACSGDLDGKTLDDIDIRWLDEAACCVVMASGGYPAKYATGFEISGLSDACCSVYHAGTRYSGGKFYTSGGRVLGVTARGATMDTAIRTAYENVRKIHFDDVHYRSDIGKKYDA